MKHFKIRKECIVTPCVGVWIEIDFEHTDVDYRIASLPAWECGLKSRAERSARLTWSLPAWECGLKSFNQTVDLVTITSLPAWECGLKYVKHL